jgi:hypothetical protein
LCCAAHDVGAFAWQQRSPCTICLSGTAISFLHIIPVGLLDLDENLTVVGIEIAQNLRSFSAAPPSISAIHRSLCNATAFSITFRVHRAAPYWK